MKRTCLPVIVAALVTCLGFSGTSFAAGSAAKIFKVAGKPQIMKEGSSSWSACESGMRIDNGDRIKTGKGEFVDITLLGDKSNVIKIEENTDSYIRKSEAPYRIEILNGAVMALIKKLPKGSTFEIATPAGLSGARGTGWRSSTNGVSADFQCFESSIYVRGIDQNGEVIEGELTVGSGWAAFIEKFEKPERMGRLSDADIERWNAWKKELEDKFKEMERNLDRASEMQSKIDRLESQKLDIKESRDTERAESVQERQENKSSGEYHIKAE